LRRATAAAIALFAFAAQAQTQRTTTLCATAPAGTDRRLLGCGEQYTDNVLWHLDRADGITDFTATRRTTGRGAVVYVVDTGVNSDHDEFERGGGNRVIAGLDPLAPFASSVPCDSIHFSGECLSLVGVYAHGTAVASIVAGSNSGVAPEAAIVSVRAQGVNARNVSQLKAFNLSLDAIVRHAFDPASPQFRTAVVNVSASPAYADAVSADDAEWIAIQRKMKLMVDGVNASFNADANGKRFFFTLVAGNRGAGPSNQCTDSNEVKIVPSVIGPQVDGVITVGGIDRENHFWVGSCGGAAVEILAPAERLLVASISGHDQYRDTLNGQDVASGTSYAAPFVAGIAARMLEDDPTLAPAEIERRIKASASFVSSSGAPAGGRVAVLVDDVPPASGPRRRSARH
jgi:subtilisin family serine protease